MSTPVPTAMPDHSPSDPAIAALIQRAVNRARDTWPDARAILLKGSHVRGDAGPFSDIDLDVLVDVDVDGGEDSVYAAWFDDETDRLRHVSVAIHPWQSWWDEAAEPVEWAWGLAALEVFQLLWARDATDAAPFAIPGILHPAAGPELEDCFSDLGKVRNARLRDDALGIRLAAQGAARLCPSVLATINPGYPATPVTSPRAAFDAVLAFPLAPTGYREDLLRCLGLTAEATTPDGIAAATERLVLGTIALLEEHAPIAGGTDGAGAASGSGAEEATASGFEMGLDTALADRTLRAYVQQIHLSTGN
ncbi:MAG: nucleotidyltransferase domain-containing protein [Thermomicrobiales bacterium]